MTELAGAVEEGLLALAVATGMQVMQTIMNEAVTVACGPRGRHDTDRTAVRHGTEAGSVSLGGRRVPVRRPRVRRPGPRGPPWEGPGLLYMAGSAGERGTQWPGEAGPEPILDLQATSTVGPTALPAATAGAHARRVKRTVTATESVHVSLGRGLAVFLDDPGLLFAETPTAEDCRARRFRSVMSIDIGSGASMQQEVEVRVYAPRPDAPAVSVVLPLRLHASGHENLFPTFAGELTASPNRQGTQLTLRVSYTVPVGDRPDDAHESLTVFLAQIAKRLDTEVVRRIHATPNHLATPHHPAPKPVSLPEQDTGSMSHSTPLQASRRHR